MSSYRYNGLGQRISKTAGTTVTRYTYGLNGQLLSETTGAVTTDYLYFNGQPLALVRQGGMYYIHTDHLGTPRAVTNTYQHVVWRWDSDPFGMMAANEDPDGDGTAFVFNLRFAGQYYDKETRLHYNYFRYYDPSTGRYITSDPIGISGLLNGSAEKMHDDLSQIPSLLSSSHDMLNSEKLVNILSINTYIYTSYNPVSYIDPLGLKDYLNKCKGRYLQCANGQSEDALTLRNWVSWKICKAAVDKSCSTGFPSCCDSEYKICMRDAGLDEEKSAVCAFKQAKCISIGRGGE